MLLALAVFGAGLSVLLVIVLARVLDAWSWCRNVAPFRLQVPATLSAGDLAGWLNLIAASSHPPRWSLLPKSVLGLEITSTREGIAFYLLVSGEQAEATLLSSLRAALPGARLTAAPEYLTARPRFRAAAEATLTTFNRPLATKRPTSAGLLAALQPVGGHEVICVQWLFTSAGTPRPVHTAASGKDAWWSAYLLEGEVPTDAEAVRALRLKRQEGPLLRAVVRVGVSASSTARAWHLFGRAFSPLHASNSVGVRLARRWLPAWVVSARLTRRALPVTSWPLLLNTAELVGLLGLPVDGVHLPGLAMHGARQLPPAPSMPTRGAVVAVSNYPGMTSRQLALHDTDRLRHLWITGPTGTGKSTLLARLALADIAAGHGVVVVDPKNDLVDDILQRIPGGRIDDVIVLDPAKLDYPVGFNLLRANAGEHGRELAVDHVVGTFAELWKSSWGARTSDVLRNTLLTLAHSSTVDGSAYTLAEVAPLLTQPVLRHFVTAQPSVPETVRGFWAWYEAISDAERAQVIGPSLNKLRALTTRSSLRLMLGQSDGIDLSAVFRERKVLLVPLSKGTVGAETAQLVGALLVASLWQAALARTAVPRERRWPVFGYLDEFSDIVKLPVPLADLLSQARGLKLSLNLANQYAAQLPESIRAAVLSQTRTQIAFQLDYDDARLLARRFAPLTVEDLTGLDTYEVAIRPAVNGRTLSPVTGTTLPLPEPIRDGRALAAASRQRWGTPRREVEDSLRARLEGKRPRIGRIKRQAQGGDA
ncbi:MAG: type IV secretory system conjugative DNA transfer family protein [Mycobacteriales bacterium]